MATPTQKRLNRTVEEINPLLDKLDEDYTKAEIDTLLEDKVDKETGKGLSTNDYTTAEKTKLSGIAEGAEVNVQSNWTQSSTTADDYIKNKPTLGTASALDVAASGNASTSQVVKGNDTRLTDARNAADVSSWAKEANKPSYNGSEIALSGYAEAQSKSSVAATDTVNTAIGKLEYRVETNENNTSSIGAIIGKQVYSAFLGQDSGTAEYQMKTADFQTDTPNTQQCGIYIVYVIGWSTTPVVSIYTVGYSGGTTGYNVVTKIVGTDSLINVDENRKITYTGKGKISIYAMR